MMHDVGTKSQWSLRHLVPENRGYARLQAAFMPGTVGRQA